jgi:uncharacterized alkaline shock family protein YloU/adenylate kinase family enzyme
LIGAIPFVKKAGKDYTRYMKKALHHLYWYLTGIKVFALVGRSGTGKSFRAKLVAEKYGIELIIDDGLLIRGTKIIAGKSAKREKVFLGAIKTALFDDTLHLKEVLKALEKQKFRRILLIGTSDKMIKKIAHRLGLPSPSKIVRIEEIASTEEIESAINSRKSQGHHVIPVPAVEVSRDYPHILIDSIRVFLNKKLKKKDKQIYEKAVVKPNFSKEKRGKVTVSEAALTQMVLHCAEEFDSSIIIRKVGVKQDHRGYSLDVFIHLPFGAHLGENAHGLQNYISESLQRYTGILIDTVNIHVDKMV